MTNDSSKPATPEWQRNSSRSADSEQDQQTKQAEQTEQSADAKDHSESSPDADRTALIEQAKTFLSDPAIRDATTTRKITFLESKGLTNDEIDSLLGVSRNNDAPVDSQPDNTSTSTSTSHTAEIETSTSSAKATASTPPSRDVPPIITYPEFLVNNPAQNKPPLLSLRSVLYTLYGAAGLGATLYGASEFLVKPMLKSLGDARHDLAEKTLANLSTMNEKLEKTVSTIPAHTSLSRTGANESDESDDLESITSDPTEVFHRDIATQTSPDLLNEGNTSEDNTTSSTNPHSAIDSHTSTLTQITDHLRTFMSNDTTSRDIDSTMRDRLSDLQTYLDGISYSSYNSYLNGNSMYHNIYGSSSFDSTRSNTSSASEDAIASFRADIRGVKGALLSARNFPSGRPAGVTR